MRNHQVARIVCLIVLLERSPTGMTVPQMHQALLDRGFEVSLRTVYRDAEALAQAGLPLFPDVLEADNSPTCWRFEHRLKSLQALSQSFRKEAVPCQEA